MENVIELAKAYLNTTCGENLEPKIVAYRSFIDGYNKAKEWISLDIKPDNMSNVLIRVDMKDEDTNLLVCSSDFIDGMFISDIEGMSSLLKSGLIEVKEWRYI